MEEQALFIQDFAVVLTFAFIITVLFSRIRQPVVLGYLLAGSLIGPFALGLVVSMGTINIFAELGIILLMFSIGLDFNLNKLKRVGGVALTLGIIEMVLILAMGNATGRFLGYSYAESIFLGGILAISSTAVILKILIEKKALNKEYSQIILGILIIEDIGAVVLLTLFGGIGMAEGGLLANILSIIFKILLFFTISLIFGLKFIPPFINWVKETSTQEVLLLTSLGLCFAMAAFSNYLGFSVALGAFMMGAIVSESKYKPNVERITMPVRDIFASMFFISIGMLVDISAFGSLILPVIFISIFAILSKFVVLSLGTYFSGYSGATALSVGLGMIPRGEFSLIITKQGIDQGVLGPDFYLLVVGVSIVTSIVGPRSLKSTAQIESFITRRTPVQIKSFVKYLYTWSLAISQQFSVYSGAAHSFRKTSKDIIINLLIIIIIIIGTLIVKYYSLKFFPDISLQMVLADYLGLTVSFLPGWVSLSGVILLTGLILLLPSIIIILRDIQKLIDLSLEVASSKLKFMGIDIIEKTLKNAAYAIVTVLFTLIVLPIFISEMQGLGFVLNWTLLPIIVLIGYFFWKNINRFHDVLDLMIKDTILSDKTVTPSQRETIIEMIKEDRDISLYNIIVPASSPHVDETLSELRLRNVSGVTILYIQRGNTIIRNPSPKEIVKAGDKMVVLGTEEEKEAALEYLRGESVSSHEGVNT